MGMIGNRRLFVNALTLSRVPLIAGFCAAAVFGELRGSLALEILACALMLLAGLSDLFDGMLARRWRVVSFFGKMADPLMDKVFFVVSFPLLLWLAGEQGDPVHAAVLLVFTILWILRDLWVTFMRSIASAYGANVAAMWTGKVRTALSFPAAGLIYMYLAFHGRFAAAWQGPALAAVYAIEGALVLLNLWSFAVYTLAYRPHLRRALERE